MNDSQSPSLLTRLLSTSFFAILGVAALLWFGVSTFTLISQLVEGSTVVSFDKGSLYMLGVGGGLLFLAAGGLLYGVLGKKQTRKSGAVFKNGVIGCIIVLVALPLSGQFLVNRYALKQSYQVCEEASYRWLLYSKIYYAKSDSECKELEQKMAAARSNP